MTTWVPDRRRRPGVSLSSPDVSGKPTDQFGRAVEILHRVNRTLPETVISREELIALGGHLTQISRELMALTELLCATAYHYDRTQLHRRQTAIPAEGVPTAASLLRECQDGYAAAYTSAQDLHADLRRCPTRRQRRKRGAGSAENPPQSSPGRGDVGRV